jgi:serine/threonine protein kinase
MLLAVQAIHEQRVVHSDLKPANFLFVKGALKLIDFGIAKAISNDTTNIHREQQVGTLNFMSPEAITAAPSACGPVRGGGVSYMKVR